MGDRDADRVGAVAGLRAARIAVWFGRGRDRGRGRLAGHYRVDRYACRRCSAYESPRRNGRSTGVSGSRKLLIVSGVALAVWGMGFGLYYALLVEHQALDKIGGSLATSFADAASGDMIA